jgi:hypothetical protein
MHETGLADCKVRYPHCLDSRLTDGGKVVDSTRRPHFSPQKHYKLSKFQGLAWPEGLGTLEEN